MKQSPDRALQQGIQPTAEGQYNLVKIIGEEVIQPTAEGQYNLVKRIGEEVIQPTAEGQYNLGIIIK